jgi:ABC-type glutathione transport system ATPase component
MSISVRDLEKVYPGSRHRPAYTAVANISFDVADRSALGIVGESGAGKTTVASMLMGFDTPTSGTILIDGERRPAPPSRTEQRAWARRIQIVFQDPYSSLDLHQSAGDAIDEILRLHFDLSRRDRATRVTELLEWVGLSGDRTNVLPKNLSGGQRQRLSIAKALAVQPEILILDEAVSALDVSVQAQILNLLADLRRELGLTYVFISHDLGVIRFITDDVIVMRNGQVVESGKTARVLDEPQHPYTRLLLEAVPDSSWRGPGTETGVTSPVEHMAAPADAGSGTIGEPSTPVIADRDPIHEPARKGA